MALTTKPHWDKYDGYIGNHRGVLNDDINLDTQANRVLATGKNSIGAVVIGGGQTSVDGLMIIAVGQSLTGGLLDGGINNQAGDPCDVGCHGEIVNFRPYLASDPANSPNPQPGKNYYGHPDGSVLASTAIGARYVGRTAETDRLIVDVSPGGHESTIRDNTPVGAAAAGGTGQATVSWVPVRNATGYKITKSSDGTTFVAGVPATAAANATSVVETGLAAGTWHFKIVATVGGVDSVASTAVTAVVV